MLLFLVACCAAPTRNTLALDPHEPSTRAAVRRAASYTFKEWADNSWLFERTSTQHQARTPMKRSSTDLLVFFPGTLTTCGNYTSLLALAGSSLNTLCLSYCLELPGWTNGVWSPGCTGPHHTFEAKAANAVTRLVRALEHLERYPAFATWKSQYMTDGEVLWSRVRVAGHSQGAVLAARLAYDFALARVIMLSGPACQFKLSLSWLVEWPRPRTSHERVYAVESAYDHTTKCANTA